MAANNFGTINNDLRKVFANAIQKLCPNSVHSQDRSFTALTSRKAIASAIKKRCNYVHRYTSVLNKKQASRRAIHFINMIYEDYENTYAFLLVDTCNAFYPLNRQVLPYNKTYT